ncbi:LysR family transcriptional regulator, nitrogen assimilation regulatory protein [Roseateles sp. YR242]|uniref:LysR family transcriptional regulator n=1 Tax=Roseateles sp. YR242 TaxID=1855305 RepID=UPI0008B7676D|nr:LysR family transcriptional regulator [Roseateles sp. YR242]SEL65629.1 LysR family transcriptional regulator, nitrogen assimilation regulatory protein [Roseateles sp. YR242]
MNLTQLETFVHVAEHGSFSKAALVLGVAQPALSRQVRALETELHETLLLRNGRGVQLTEAGRRLLQHGQDILNLVSHAKEDLRAQRSEPVGQITIAMPPTLARVHTLALIRAFQQDMPQARLAIMEGFSVHLTEWLLTGRTDLALVYNPEPVPALEILPLRKERLCLVSPKNEAPTKPPTLKQLSRYPLVMPQRGHIFRTLMEQAAAMAGVQLEVQWEVSSVPAILDCVAAGIGHAALGEEALRIVEHPERLVVTPFARADIQSTLCLVTPTSKRATPLMQRTAALLMRLVSEAPLME